MTGEEKSGEQKTERFNMFMSPSEMKEIDEWAWKNRIRSKSEAIRRLVQIGLAFDEKADDLHAALVAMSSGMVTRAEQMMTLSELPSESDPQWLAPYIVAAGGFAQVAFEHIVKVSAVAQAMDARRHFMKMGDVEYESAAAGSIAYKANMLIEDLQQRITEFERDNRSEDKK